MINPSQSAVRFIELMQVNSGRSASLGSKDSFTNDNVRRAIGQAHEDVAASVATIVKLGKSETRTPLDKNYRGKQEADTLIPKLAKARDTLRAEADKIETGTMAQINEKLSLDPSRLVYHQMKLNWVKEQWQDPANGRANIDKQIREDIELAALINGGSGYLLGMSKDVQLGFAAKAVKAHMPEAAAALATAEKVRETADKYDGVIGNVRSSFYLAEQAEIYERTHVE